ncbi:E3 ubiquitin/ISG15 ligase TRIM25-like isoform X2 [Sinocyclocheilus rhinocerous]|uniref:E3 ubiquitin/ISG15 ligase TRIM25-like isoform X2 n=1 Tax=Sinocyclocheilus rhinocerous TaxID=307959 RepID=UPI0007B9C3FC|nr:PREDICTED: E3 ubiquitin/ISG15 ligase TRIM25-like isoform X2 [Sinocyclocheilus rhinocerous]
MVSVSSNCNNMAESSDDQNPFNCPICLHLLKNPVSTSCGHSFCMDCLNECWDRDDQKGVYSCPQCRQTFSPRPVLSRNTVLSEVVERMKREAPEAGTASPVLSFAVSGDVECDICTETKLKAFKACLICSQHHKPLELYCSQDQQLICVQCALINHQNHNLTSPAAERQKIQGRLQNQDGLQREIHQRELKVQELREAVDSHKRSAEAAVKHSEKVFTELISSMEKRRVKITDMIRAQEKSEVSRVEELVLTLEQEISDLRKKHAELGQLSLIEDDIYVIQNFLSVSRYQCSNLCDISISQHLTFEEIETVVSDLKSQLDDLCEQDILWISEKVPTIHIMVNNEKITAYLPSKPKNREEFFIYSSELNLNHSSACTQLSVKNNKSVSRRDVQQSTDSWNPVLNQSVLNSISKRTYQVLCKESLSGRCYFEVQWGGTGCSIAFSYDQINKGGGTFIFGSNNRSWKCDFPAANLCVWNNGQQTNISLVSKIGVFLDQEAGTVSFYNVSDKMTLLHRIQTTFSQPLYTGFSFKDWKNYSSVTICDLANQNE